MKRLILLCLAAVLVLAGCAPAEQGEGDYLIYGRTALETSGGGDAIGAWRSTAMGEPAERVASALVHQILAPGEEGYESPLPQGTRLLSLHIENGLATVDLSAQYAGLSGVDLTIADACITLTLCQMPAVERVCILAQGNPLPYRLRQTMTADEVLLSGRDEEVRTLRARIFFADAQTGALGSESRTIQMYEGQTRAMAVVEALLAGPESEGLLSVIPDGVDVLSVRTEEGVCYVNFSQEFLEMVPHSLQEQENVVYSVVKSLCSVSDIEAVQLVVEGETAAYYGGIAIGAPLS